MEIHEGGSLRAVALRCVARVVARPTLGLFPVRGPLAPGMGLVDHLARVVPHLPSTVVEEVADDGWRAELVSMRDNDPSTREAIVYFHGGAFVFGGLASHRRIAERLAHLTGRPVLSVAYRQAPQVRVEGSIADCVAAVNRMIDRGYDPHGLVLAGDSAGGSLAFSVALAARDCGLDVAGVVALSPWVEFDNSLRRKHRNAWRDDMIPTFRLARIARHVHGTRTLDPLCSPVNADLRGLPPVLLICAAGEILRYDAELMAERLEAADVQVQLHVWRGQVHAFPVFADLVPESRAALDLVAGFVDDVLGSRAVEGAAKGASSGSAAS